jgi:hypothetical protein
LELVELLNEQALKVQVQYKKISDAMTEMNLAQQQVAVLAETIQEKLKETQQQGEKEEA